MSPLFSRILATWLLAGFGLVLTGVALALFLAPLRQPVAWATLFWLVSLVPLFFVGPLIRLWRLPLPSQPQPPQPPQPPSDRSPS